MIVDLKMFLLWNMYMHIQYVIWTRHRRCNWERWFLSGSSVATTGFLPVFLTNDLWSEKIFTITFFDFLDFFQHFFCPKIWVAKLWLSVVEHEFPTVYLLGRACYSNSIFSPVYWQIVFLNDNRYSINKSLKRCTHNVSWKSIPWGKKETYCYRNNNRMDLLMHIEQEHYKGKILRYLYCIYIFSCWAPCVIFYSNTGRPKETKLLVKEVWKWMNLWTNKM